MKRPEWFPWDDDPSNENGWYDRHEAEVYFAFLEARIVELEAKIHEERRIMREQHAAHVAELEARLSKAREALEHLKNWGDKFPHCSDGQYDIDCEDVGIVSMVAGDALEEIWPDGGNLAD